MPSKTRKRGGGRHLGKLVPWSLVLANQLFGNKIGKKVGKSRRRRRGRKTKRRRGRN